MRLTLIRKKSRGFTLMEVMVGTAIIGILAAIAIPNYLKHREKGFIARASGDLKSIQRKVQDLGHDTGKWPTIGAPKKNVGDTGHEIWDLSHPNAGLAGTDGNFPDWQGPYLTGPFKDPWGKNYFLDTDFTLDDGRKVAVVGSFGPNQCCPNTYDDDDIILIIPGGND